MRIFKLMMIALVAMIGLNSCSEDCDHNFIEHDFTQDIVGTWTFVEKDLAEAMVIKADGSFTTTGVMRGGSMYEEKGTIKVENNKVTLAFDGDNETFEGRLEFVAGKSLSLVMFDDNDVRLTYDYCDKDLSDEIVGMWICNDAKDNMRIHSFDENGNAVFTGWSEHLGEFSVLENSNYKVVGDLIFQGFSNGEKYIASKLVYDPNGNAYGNIMLFKHSLFDGTESVQSWLRVKQNLNLTGKTYDYISAYVSNVKGADEDFTILGNTFNISKIDSNNFDMFFRSVLSCLELNGNTIKFTFNNNGRESVFNDPITVEGNKVTVDMSVENPACRKVEMYMFQDQDNTQLHMYMHTNSFVNYFANLGIPGLIAEGKLDPSDTAAVEKVFADMESRIESINVSLVYKARK
jgi:hypothetical protein